MNMNIWWQFNKHRINTAHSMTDYWFLKNDLFILVIISFTVTQMSWCINVGSHDCVQNIVIVSYWLVESFNWEAATDVCQYYCSIMTWTCDQYSHLIIITWRLVVKNTMMVIRGHLKSVDSYGWGLSRLSWYFIYITNSVIVKTSPFKSEIFFMLNCN